MIRRKSIKEKSASSVSKLDIFISLKILAILVLVFLIFKHKWLLLLVVFEMLDLVKNLLRPSFPYLPLDLVFVFGITASYYFSVYVGLFILMLGIFNRLFLMCIEERHMSKALRHLLFFFGVILFRDINFFAVAMAALTLNYILKYGLRVAKGDYRFDTAPFNLINYATSTCSFYIIYTIYHYFSFLL